MILELEKTKFTGLDGRVVVAFVQKNSTKVDPFTITASPSGISFKGTMEGEFTKQNDLEVFAKLFSEIWKERLRLRPSIVTSPSGH